MVMSALMYLPFLRAYERSLMKNEEQKAQNSAPMAKPSAVSEQGEK
jgi:PTS system cellobiose-specific IIC component